MGIAVDGATAAAFPSEPYLLHPPPDYPKEWHAIKVKLILTAAFFVIVVPALVVPFLFSTNTKTGSSAGGDGGREDERQEGPSPAAAGTSSNGSGKRRRENARGKRGRKKSAAGGGSGLAAEGTAGRNGGKSPSADAAAAAAAAVAVPPLFIPTSNVLCLLLMILTVANSPNNRYAAKHVFHAPLLTPEECDAVVDMARAAAERNLADAVEREAMTVLAGGGGGGGYQVTETRDVETDTMQMASADEEGRRVVDEPKGWRKDRHTSYPTTDLNLVTDHFTREDLEWIRRRLDARLAPIIERTYGIPPGAIRANDMFVVRYDASMGQRSLRVHKDSSHVSFNVLLNDEFEGGGTRYHEVKGGKAWDLKPDKGEVLLNNALVLHEGLPVTSGTRYIMVGFMNVDTFYPLQTMDEEDGSNDGKKRSSTGVSAFASWLSAPWLVVRFKAGVNAAHERLDKFRAGVIDPEALRWTDNKYVVSLFKDVWKACTVVMDLWAPFTFTQLVSEENRSEYLAALDRAAEEEEEEEKAAEVTKGDKRRASATWFKGQQIDVDIDGSVARIWRTREEAGEGKFRDL